MYLNISLNGIVDIQIDTNPIQDLSVHQQREENGYLRRPDRDSRLQTQIATWIR